MKKKNRKVISIVILAALLVLQMSLFVKADELKMAPISFTLVSEQVKKDNASVILLYKGELSDLCVELRADQDYIYETELPIGEYELTEIIATNNKEYIYDVADTLVIRDMDNTLDIDTKDAEVEEQLRTARAEELTERNLAKQKGEEKEIGLKVGDNINTTEDNGVKENPAKKIVWVILVVVIIVFILTIVTTYRAQQNPNNKKDDK